MFDSNVIPLRKKTVNVASVPQRSPFRYPGGKTWLVPEIRAWLRMSQSTVLVEPFTGGGIASLTAVADGLVERAVMCEKDSQMAAAWRTVLDHGEWLADRILGFEMTDETIRTELETPPLDDRILGFQTILRNRVQRGGILAKGASLMRTGENGRGVASRWYPATLARRIREIGLYRHRIEFIEGDAFAVIRQHAHDPRAAFFVDPPYTAGGKNAGKRLYTHSQIDHSELFDAMRVVRGDFMMTYDDSAEVIALARVRRFTVRGVPMKNTHHATMQELLILPERTDSAAVMVRASA